jgi:hypothetical protein
MNKVLESTKFVVDSSKHVKINTDKINDFCNHFKKKKFEHWFKDIEFINKLDKKNKLHFLLIINSLNFCYWGSPKWTIEYGNKKYDGGYAILYSLIKAIENKIPILNMNFLKTLTETEFKKIVNGNTEIPLFEERLKILKEIGRVVFEKFNNNFEILIKESYNTTQLLESITYNFPSFDDISIYKDKKIYFYKRAQLLIYDIFCCYSEIDKNIQINELTACADYKLPQVLRRLEIIEYSKYLSDKIDNKIEIKKDSDEENEIRANTVWTIDLIKKQLEKKIPLINSIEIDSYLWLLGQEKSCDDKPYHLTRTTAY